MLTLLPSDPLYPALDWLITMRAAWINAGCHYDLAGVPEAERAAAICQMTEELHQVFEELSR